jgi:transporter family protein
VKSLIVISLVVVLKVIGEVCLSHGMHQIGEVDPFQPMALLGVGLRTLINPWVDIAMTTLLSHTLLYMSALSWLDLSFMMPMMASCYVLNALFAWLLLDEQIPVTRWLGTAVIMVGVILVGVSDRKTSRQKAAESAKQRRETQVHRYEGYPRKR